LVALISGELLILFCGGLWLAFGLGMGIDKAFYLGILPFIPGDLIKIAICAAICKKYIKRSRQIFS